MKDFNQRVHDYKKRNKRTEAVTRGGFIWIGDLIPGLVTELKQKISPSLLDKSENGNKI